MLVLGIQIQHQPSACLFEDDKLVWYQEERKTVGKKRVKDFPYWSLINLLKDYKTLDHCILTGYNYSYDLVQMIEGYFDHMSIKIKNPIQFHDRPHHISHAFKSFFDSGFDEARIFVVDGKGSNYKDTFETTSVYHFKKNSLKCLYKRAHSKDNLDLGRFYEAITNHWNFKETEEGKFMGFQSFGIPQNNYKDKYSEDDVKNLNMHLNTAATCQQYFEDKYKELVEKYKFKNMVFTGGTALNVVNNYKLQKHFSDYNLWFDPLCEDVGNCIGAAYMQITNLGRNVKKLENIYLGEKIWRIPNGFKDAEVKDIVKILEEGHVVGLIQGPTEAGPRALGNRSLLLDPTLPDAKDKMNQIKKREKFRPFACSILKDAADDYFDMLNLKDTPFMMHAPQARFLAKDTIPSLVHADNTCRVQTVGPDDNKILYKLLKNFKVPVLMNTSFNLAGKPIASNFDQVMDTFKKSSLKYIYFADFNKLCIKD